MKDPEADPHIACVLILDDHPQLRQMFAVALQTAGFDVLDAASATDAQQLLVGKRPEAMVLDLQGADSYGLDLLRWFRRRADLDDVPIVFLAGQASDNLHWEALEAGADWFSFKPLSVCELQERVADLVSNGRPRRRLPKYEHARDLLVG